MKIQIPIYVSRVMEKLEDAGFEAYIVGGCVRDALLMKTPFDYDVTTSAKPDEVKAVLEGYRIIETGIKHGTVTALSDGNPIEITTFRCDGEYTDHRRPDSVTLTDKLSEDLCRRDFTVNAMAYSEKRGLIDLYGGKEDLECGVIRAVGDAERRFDEDALRIMRAIRFASTLDFKIEEKTALAIENKSHLLRFVSAERVATELTKLLCGNAAARILTDHSSVICHIIPELKEAIGLQQKNPHHIYDVYTHIVKVIEATPPVPHLRYAALFHDIAKPKMMTIDEKGVGHFYGHPKESALMARDIMKRLKMDNKTINTVCRLVEIHDVRPEATPKSIKKYLAKYPDVDTDDIMAIRRADLAAQNPIYHNQFEYLAESERIINELKSSDCCISVSQLQVNGSDIAELGAKGKEIGDILKRLLRDVVEEKIENEKSALIKRAKQLIKL